MTQFSSEPRARVLPAAARHPRIWLAAAAATVAVAPLTRFDDDALAAGLAQLPWESTATVLVLLAVCASHFLSAAYGLRSIVGKQVALWPTTLAQVAAAATNRIVPNGIGGTGVNLRYLLRSGVPAGSAATGLAALAVVAGLTDAGYITAVSSIGPAVGIRGAAHELSALAARGAGSSAQRWMLLAAGAGVIILLVRGRRAIRARLVTGFRDALRHVRELCLQPSRLLVAAAASMGCTAVLSCGFVLAVRTWGLAPAGLPAGALIAIYLVATAAGGTAPVPAFLGVTEVALVGGLVLGGYTTPSAVTAVAVFRLVTYWLPLPVGMWMARRLRVARLL